MRHYPREPLEVHRGRGEEGLDAHVLQAAPDGSGEAVPGFGLAVGVRPCRWTGSRGSFDRGTGVAILELNGAEIAQGGV